jgi:protein-S-isoprenylcysteine O-methyltransferase
MYQACLIALSTLWVASEVALAIRRRAGTAAASKDAGTLKLLNVVIYFSVAAGMAISFSRYGHAATPATILWASLVVIAAGLALRWWAVMVLGKYFSVDVAIHGAHHLIQAGPYKHLRHPTYSGILLSFLGLAISTSNWLSAVMILIPITAAFLIRIRVEENALREALPAEYGSYSRRTRRLIPGIY